jgi:hypothetical protein
MYAQSILKVEIDFLQSKQRPDTDVYQPDSGNCAMANGRGLYPRTNCLLERGSQPRHGHAGDQRSGDRSKPPASPADSKCKHCNKDATVRSRTPRLTENPRKPILG